MIVLSEAYVARAIGAPNREAALALVGWPMNVRGYGPVKAASWREMQARRVAWVRGLRRCNDGGGGVGLRVWQGA